MIICTSLLVPFYFIIQVLIPVIREIVKTVCAWVSTVITTVKEVVSKICGYLPWPLNKLCNWVTTLITVLETIWNFVCNTVIETILDWITQIITYVIYILRIICLVIHFIIGIPALILCLLGLHPKKKLRVCIKVLTDEKGNTTVTKDSVFENINSLKKIFSQCNIEVILTSIQFVVKPQYLSTTNCSFWGIFTSWHAWFATNTCSCCNEITVYFVDNITGASGCTYWGENFCRVDGGANSDPTVMAHEIGHILSLPHSSDSNNLMYASNSSSSTKLTHLQCCIIRRSPFVTYI